MIDRTGPFTAVPAQSPVSTGCDMTRFPVRRLLALALASTLALPAMAQSVEPFTVSDIRIDGLQRIGAGTVFTYLPVERGDTLDASKAA
jgi:outer membrane protein insertion porin family